MDGTVYPVHNNKFKFGTAGLLSTDAEMVVPKDLTNFAPTIDGTTDEWYAMDAEGWAKSAVTGKEAQLFVSGQKEAWAILATTILPALHYAWVRMQ